MPFQSVSQEKYLRAVHPEIAERWTKEHGSLLAKGKKRAGPGNLLVPRNFDHLKGNLTGISDRTIEAHLQLYRGYVDRLNSIQARYPMVDWTAPSGSPGTPIDPTPLLEAPVASLKLQIEGVLQEAIAIVLAELWGKGVAFTPHFYLGDEDFWTTDRATSINVPWFLADPKLWALANEVRATTYSPGDVLRTLRHELGHAVGYAYRLHERPEWRAAFGDFDQPYPEGTPPPDEPDGNFVEYLATVPNHYPQKHPDEAWAEAFAAWLDPSENFDRWAGRPGAQAKLAAVTALVQGIVGTEPANRSLGRPESYAGLKGTVRQRLGFGGTQPFTGGAWSEHSELLRREPEIYNAVVLHELYFENLGRAMEMPANSSFVAAASSAFGSWESYLLDLRAIAGSCGDGWALTVWDDRLGRVKNVLVEGHDRGLPPGCPILLAMDMHEHAWWFESPARRDVGAATFFRNVAWEIVEGRFQAATGEGTAEVEP